MRRQHRDPAPADLPVNAIDAECLDVMHELLMVLLLDEARAQHAKDLIETEALADGSSFGARFGGKKPTYTGAPDGGSKALQNYTHTQKHPEDDDESMTGS